MREVENFKDNVVMCLVNTEQNREMLAGVPNRSFHDLSVIYRLILGTDQKGILSTVIKNELAEHVGMTEEDLFQCAKENTRQLDPIVVVSMQKLFEDKFETLGLEPDMEEELKQGSEVAESMWVIRNSSGIRGAVAMLYEENLHKLAESVGSDLYILPASVDEVIAVSTEWKGKSAEEWAETVYATNMSDLEPEERLSNNVYHYDKDLRKITMATDVRDKSLNGEPVDFLSEEEPEIGEGYGGR